MRLRYAALSFALASLCAAPAMADERAIGIGGDLLFTLPLGDFKDATGPLVGASIRAGYYVMPQFEGYARVGYQLGLKKDQGEIFGTKIQSSIDNIPLYVGGRYFIMQPYSGLYGNLEVGLNMLKGKATVGDQSSSSDTQSRFGLNVGLGYVISEELPVNIAVQYAMFNLAGKEEGEKTQSGINFMVGYEARF